MIVGGELSARTTSFVSEDAPAARRRARRDREDDFPDDPGDRYCAVGE